MIDMTLVTEMLPKLVDIDSGSIRCQLINNIIFAREQKCINNHFGMDFCAEMVVTNTLFVLKKFLVYVFSLINFFIYSKSNILNR